MRVVATYVIFEEEEQIAESVRTMKDLVDAFVFVDAAFTYNPVEVTHSTDDTRRVAEAAAHPVPFTYYESDHKMTQVQARNKTFSFLRPADWAFVIDGDETMLGRYLEAEALMAEARAGLLGESVGIEVFTAALRFNGNAPDISEEEYPRLPIIYTRGVQPRLLRAHGVRWGQTPIKTVAPFREKRFVREEPVDPRIKLVNHRVRQAYGVYQNDFVWEMNELGKVL